MLGLVVEQPRHGYDLERTIAERGIRQWAEVAFSSIYYVLGKLEARGLVRSAQGDGKKTRRVYSATEEGRSAAADAAASMLCDAAPSFSPFVVGLANVGLVDFARFHALLRDRVRVLSERVADIEATRDAQGQLPLAARLVFSYTLATLTAERDWLTLTAVDSGDAA